MVLQTAPVQCDVCHIAHQCTRFVESPKDKHGQAIRWASRHLLGTRHLGMMHCPDPSRRLEVFVDADFAGNWEPEEAADD